MNIIEAASRYLGMLEGSEAHREFIDNYNKIRPAGSYAMTYADPWCAAFVSYCAYLAGIKNFPIAVNTETIRKGLRLVSEPKTGYLVLFDWTGDGVSDHIGIVDWIEENKITTIEGNTSDKCSRRSYTLPDKNIIGFLELEEVNPPKTSNPDYSKPKPYNSDFIYPVIKKGSTGDFVLVCQALLACRGYEIEVDGEAGPQTIEAIRRFQQVNGYPKSERCDRYTWPHLLEGDYARG